MKRLFFAAFAAFGLFAVSCAKSDDLPSGPDNDNGSGKLSVSIRSENNGTRAVGNPSQALENTVHSFTVYVFNNSTGVLEKSESFTSGLNGEISGLSVASSKKVVVLVNKPENFPTIGKYADFGDNAFMVSLDSQVPEDFSRTGLLMSGETSSPVKLNANSTVSVPVTVKRVTSKVALGKITVTPEDGLSIENFALKGVSVQMARDKAGVLGGLATSGFGYVGGIDGNDSKPYLYEPYSLPSEYVAGTAENTGIHFYVLPNDNTDNRATLLTLDASYLGVNLFFPFVINGKAQSGNPNPADGTYIGRNKIYTLNVHLRKIANGSEDPDVPNESVSMEVTVDVADWDGELVQEEEW